MMEEQEVFTIEEAAELAQMQRVRLSLIQTLTGAGDSVPDTGPKQVMLLGLLDGADRSTLARAKLRAEKKRDDTMQNAVKVVGEVLKSVNMRTYRPVATPLERLIPEALMIRTFVPVEIDIGIEPIDHRQLIDD